MSNGGRKPTKIDVELRQLNFRFRLLLTAEIGILVIVGVAASAIPLYFLRGIVEPLAGETTKVDVNIALVVTTSLSVAVNIAQAVKGQFRKTEMERERDRADSLEGRLGNPPEHQ